VVDRSDDASCLLGLAGCWRSSVSCSRPFGVRIVQLVTDDPDRRALARCVGTLSTSGKDWVLTPPARPAVWWLGRWRCSGASAAGGAALFDCARQVVHRAGRPGAGGGMRTTTRLRAALAVAVEDGRDQSEVALSHRARGVVGRRCSGGRWVARGALRTGRARAGAGCSGMDETRFRAGPRWLPDGHHDDGRVRWVRTDPWETGFVDITGDQALLGQVDMAAPVLAVKAWLAARTPVFRAGIEVVVNRPPRWLRACRRPRGSARRSASRSRPLPSDHARE